MQLQKCVQAAKVAAVTAHSCEEQGRMDALSDLLEETAALVDLCKVDTNVGLHAWCGNLEHPGSGVQPLCQARYSIDGLQSHGISETHAQNTEGGCATSQAKPSFQTLRRYDINLYLPSRARFKLQFAKKNSPLCTDRRQCI